MLQIGIIGCGRLTEELINTMIDKDTSFDKLVILDNQDKVGKRLKIEELSFKVENLDTFELDSLDVIFVLMNKKNIEPYATKLKETKAYVIDSSECFAYDYMIPSVVVGVNDNILSNIQSNIVNSPSAICIMLSKILHPLYNIQNIGKVFVSTYQGVSNEGEEALGELFEQTRCIYANSSIVETKNIFTKQIAFNLIPHIKDFTTNGNTQEEELLCMQSNKVLNVNLDIVATCVRVPIFIGEALSVMIEVDGTEEEIKNIITNIENVKVVDYRANDGYVSPFEAIGEEDVYISRVRMVNNNLAMWVVADNMKVEVVNMLNIYEKLKFVA